MRPQIRSAGASEKMSAPDPAESKDIKIVLFESEIEKQAGKVAGRVFGTAADGLMGVAGDIIGALVTDRIKEWRTRNLVNSLAKTAELLKAKSIPLEKTKALPMGDAYAMFEEASKQDDPTIQDMWAALLANALDPDSDVRIEPAYVSTLKVIGGAEAKILDYICNFWSERAVIVKSLPPKPRKIIRSHEDEEKDDLITREIKRAEDEFRVKYVEIFKSVCPNASEDRVSRALLLLVKEGCIFLPSPTFSYHNLAESRGGRSDSALDLAKLEDALNEISWHVDRQSGDRGALADIHNLDVSPISLNYNLTGYGERLLAACQVSAGD